MSEAINQEVFFDAMSGEKFLLHPLHRRVRAQYNGVMIADSEGAFVSVEWRDPARRIADIENNVFWMGHSFYFFPIADVKMENLVASEDRREDPRIGRGTYYSFRVGRRMVHKAAWIWDEPVAGMEHMAGLVGMNDLALDAMFEEEDELTAPRNPYHAVEVRNSSKHVRVVLDGVEIANSRNARMLFETGLPTRFYLPKQDVRMEYLEVKDLVTQCPYKGHAEYWDVRVNGQVHDGVVWSYKHPYPNVSKLEHLLGFYEERGMTIYVDGVARVAPGTAFPKGFLTKPESVPAESAPAGVAPATDDVVVEELPGISCACEIAPGQD